MHPSINQRSILTIVSHMMPLSYGMIFHMIYAVLQISPVSKVDSKPTYFRNHSHHSFLLPNTGPPLWERLGTCLMSYALRIGWCALESIDTEIKHLDNWLIDWLIIKSQGQGWYDHWGHTVLTWPLGLACLATRGQSEWFCGTGGPATSPLCPRWLLVGRHTHPDPPMVGWVHPLSMPRDPVLVKQIEVTC